jgi:hypothetical protein
MSQNDDQNRDRQDQGEGYQDQSSDESTRIGRSDSQPSDSEQVNPGTSRQDQGSDLDDADDVDDEDRDEDSRADGGPNRRNNIG